MSPCQAAERAQEIWGNVPKLIVRYDDELSITTATPVHGSTEHRMNDDGHAICHEECIEAERDLDYQTAEITAYFMNTL